MYGPRGTQVSRVLGQLPSLGWRPTVICLAPRRGGPHWTEHAAPLPTDVDLIRVPSPAEWAVMRAAFLAVPALRDYPDAGRLWVRPAAAAAMRHLSPDNTVLITFAQPWSDHLVGLRLRRATHIPWVAHFSDPWSDSPYATPRQRAIWRPMEDAVVAAASALVFVTDETADLVMRKYPTALHSKVAVVPHGHRGMLDASPAGPPDDASRAMRVLHAGRFYRNVRTPSVFLQALADVHRRASLQGRIEVTFLGPHADGFSTEADRLGVGDFVRFVDRVPVQDAEAAAREADVLLVIDAPSDGPSVFLPSKLIDYLPFRKPILGLTPESGASARLLRRLGCPVVPPDRSQVIASTVEDLLRRWESGTLGVGDSFESVAAGYDIRCTARALHDVLLRAVA